MNNLISPYNSGDFQMADNAMRINIDELVNCVKKELKIRLLQAKIEALGIEVSLTTSKTRFNGDRFWFLCPICQIKVGTLYKHPLQSILGCRNCLELKYKSQRYKGMIESGVPIPSR